MRRGDLPENLDLNDARIASRRRDHGHRTAPRMSRIGSPSPRALAVVATGAGVFILASTTAARAGGERGGAVLVTGAVTAHERDVLHAQVADAVRAQQWTMTEPAFAPADVDAIAGCMRDDRPWPCLRRVLEPHGIDRIVVLSVRVTPGAARKLAIYGQLAAASTGVAAVVQQRCDPCDDAALVVSAQQLAQSLLGDAAARSAQTRLVLRVDPPDAQVTLDDQPLRTASRGRLEVPAHAGPHRLVVQRAGYRTDARTIEIAEGARTELAVQLESPDARGHSWLAPAALAVGGAGILTGGYLIYLGQRSGHKYRYTRATGVGIGVGVVGAAALGFGLWQLMRERSEDDPARRPMTAGAWSLDSGGDGGWSVTWLRSF